MLSHTFISSDKPWILHPVYFVRWWYARAFVRLVSVLFFFLATVEDSFSLVVMLRAIITLQPLHQDFSVVGRGIGIVIRLFWVVIGTLVFAVSIALAAVLGSVWLALPVALFAGFVLTLLF